MKILIAVPTFETITPNTFKSIYDLDKGGHELSFEFVKGYDCAKARNDIGKKTLDGGYDAVLMVDSDIVVPKDAVVKMAEKSFDIVLGCYPKKNTKEGLVELFRLGKPNYVDRFTYANMPKERFIVKGGGFGCALVNAHVLKRLKFPWFKFVVYDSGGVLSEDLYFCDCARKAGFIIDAEPGVQCGHLTRYFQYE